MRKSFLSLVGVSLVLFSCGNVDQVYVSIKIENKHLTYE